MRFVGLVRLVGLVGLVACSSYGVDPDTYAISGEWKWVRSSGGIAGRLLTPASEGYTVKSNFDANSVNALRNDSVKSTARYVISGTNLHYSSPINVFVFDPQIANQTLRVLKGDSIALADPCCDRYEHVFVRIR